MASSSNISKSSRARRRERFRRAKNFTFTFKGRDQDQDLDMEDDEVIQQPAVFERLFKVKEAKKAKMVDGKYVKELNFNDINDFVDIDKDRIYDPRTSPVNKKRIVYRQHSFVPGKPKKYFRKIVETNDVKEMKDENIFQEIFDRKKKLEDELDSDDDDRESGLTPHVINDAAKRLHMGLKMLLITHKYMLRLPFKIDFKEHTITMGKTMCSFALGVFVAQAVFITILLLWLSLGLFFMYFFPLVGVESTCEGVNKFLLYAGQKQVKKYFLEIAHIWLLLVFAVITNLYQIYLSKDYAIFIKGWYLLVDKTGILIQGGVTKYVLVQYMLVSIRLLLIIVLWTLVNFGYNTTPPFIFGTSRTIGHSMMAVIKLHKHDMINKRGMPNDPPGYSVLGLVVYVVGIYYCEMSLLLYKVSCLLLKNALEQQGRKIVYCLHHHRRESLLKESNYEELKERATYSLLYDDLVKIITHGKKIGPVFDSLLLVYYFTIFWKLLVNVCMMSYTEYRDPKTVLTYRNNKTCKWDPFLEMDTPAHILVSHMGHLLLGLWDFFSMTMVAIDVSETSRGVHEIIRRHGLINCRNAVERNFIRSMYGLGDLRRAMVISPGHLFSIQKDLISDFILVIFLYYVLILQMKLLFETSRDRSEKSSNYSAINCSVLFDIRLNIKCMN